MKDFTSIRNNVNIYRLDEYFQYLKEKEEKKQILIAMRKNYQLRRFLGAKLGVYKVIGVFESEGVFALTNGVNIVYMNVEEVMRFMKTLLK